MYDFIASTLAAITGTALGAAFAASISLFPVEQDAHAHCPKDTVVWLNVPSGVYHTHSDALYGVTKMGAYACMREAIATGARRSNEKPQPSSR